MRLKSPASLGAPFFPPCSVRARAGIGVEATQLAPESEFQLQAAYSPSTLSSASLQSTGPSALSSSLGPEMPQPPSPTPATAAGGSLGNVGEVRSLTVGLAVVDLGEGFCFFE